MLTEQSIKIIIRTFKEEEFQFETPFSILLNYGLTILFEPVKKGY